MHSIVARTRIDAVESESDDRVAAARNAHAVEMGGLTMTIPEPVLVPIGTLRPHPRNYRTHTPAQLAHICQSIRDHGLYRNIVTARDRTILAGHGVIEAARALGLVEVPIIQLDLAADDPRALKVLVGDNQIGQLAVIDDRELTTILREINTSDLTDLIGTGFDATQLAALVMTSRPASEIEDFNAAAEWVGLPNFQPAPEWVTVTVYCETEKDRTALFDFLHVELQHIVSGSKRTKTIWWPLREKRKRADSFENVAG
jgi:ParB/Sulfiredoxin domain